MKPPRGPAPHAARRSAAALIGVASLILTGSAAAGAGGAPSDVDRTCAVAVPIAVARGIAPPDATVAQLRPVAIEFERRASSAPRKGMKALRRRIVANLDSPDAGIARKELDDTRRIVGECVALLGFDFMNAGRGS